MEKNSVHPSSSLKIGAINVGVNFPVFFVAEIGMVHDGSLGTAHAYIDAVAKSGAQAIKFQTHIADAESTPGEAFRVNFSYQDATRYEYWKRLEFTAEQWVGLKKHADEVGLMFLSTPFSFEAADLLYNLGVPAFKVASGETTNLPMLDAMAKRGLPILISTGMSSWDEIDAAVSTVKKHNDKIGIFQCTSAYPCPPEAVGLNVISELQFRYKYPVGLSDHSGMPHASIAACALGASMIEVHTVFSKGCFGPDVGASILLDDLPSLVQGCEFVRQARSNPIDKDAHAASMADMKALFGKSLYIARDVVEGQVIQAEDLDLRKPAAGILARDYDKVLGKTACRDLEHGATLQWDHLVGGES